MLLNTPTVSAISGDKNASRSRNLNDCAAAISLVLVSCPGFFRAKFENRGHGPKLWDSGCSRIGTCILRGARIKRRNAQIANRECIRFLGGVTLVRLLEHQGKNLFKSLGVIRVPEGEIASSQDQARCIAQRLGKSVAIKAQVPVTGRFKAGGIGFADDPDETANVSGQILGSNIKGFIAGEVLVEERIDVQKEFYLGLAVDDSYKVKAPVLMFSTRGGVDIEQIVADYPGEVGRTTVNVLDGLSLDEVENSIRSLGVSLGLVKRLGTLPTALTRSLTDTTQGALK
jgi:hypothetical protein